MNESDHKHNDHHQPGHSNKTITRWAPYRTLTIILLVVTLSAIALSLETDKPQGFMRSFMGLFLIQFSMFKLFDLPSFVRSFSGYDIVAKHSTIYAWCFPFIELVLGFLYLSGFWLWPVNLVTAILMSIGAIGVALALISGNRNLRCACLGSTLNLPLGTVSLLEYLSMAAMAIWLL